MKVKKSYALDEEVVNRVEDEAKTEGRSESNYVNKILREALEID